MLPEYFLKILNEKWLPNLIGLVGGTLGAYAFVDNYLLKFKPKIYMSTQVLFKQKETKLNRKELDNIVLTLEIANRRKKYGLIYDLAVRIYKTDEINPDTLIYYSSEIAAELIFDGDQVTINDIKPFTPISVLPNSSKSAVLLFGDVVNRSKVIDVNSYANFYVELFYQCKPKGKWRFVDKIFLYNLSERNRLEKREVDANTIYFTSLNYDNSRTKIEKTKKSPTTTIYTGAFHREKIAKYYRITYTLRKPFLYIFAIFQGPFIYVKLFINKITDKVIRIPILKKYSKSSQQPKIIFGNKDLKPFTIAAISELHEILSELADAINKGIDESRTVKVNEIQQQSFVISCYHMSLKIYMSSDTSIRVQEVNAQYGSKIRFNYMLKENILKQRTWQLEKVGYMSTRSFAIKILDFLVLYYSR